MQIEFLTKDDFSIFKTELLSEINNLFQSFQPKPAQDVIRTDEARKILQCSKGKFHTLLTNGSLPFTKVLGTIYLKRSDVMNLITNPNN